MVTLFFQAAGLHLTAQFALVSVITVGFRPQTVHRVHGGCLVKSSPQQHTALTHRKGMHNIGEKMIFVFFFHKENLKFISIPPIRASVISWTWDRLGSEVARAESQSCGCAAGRCVQTPAVRWVYTQLLCKVQFHHHCLHVQPDSGLFVLYIYSVDRQKNLWQSNVWSLDIHKTLYKFNPSSSRSANGFYWRK